MAALCVGVCCRDGDGERPIDVARARGHNECVSLLQVQTIANTGFDWVARRQRSERRFYSIDMWQPPFPPLQVREGGFHAPA